MTSDDSPACPRCSGPLHLFDGDRGALSRAAPARRITVCGVCGQDEATREARGLARVGPEDWPVPVDNLVVWPTGARTE